MLLTVVSIMFAYALGMITVTSISTVLFAFYVLYNKKQQADRRSKKQRAMIGQLGMGGGSPGKRAPSGSAPSAENTMGFTK